MRGYVLAVVLVARIGAETLAPDNARPEPVLSRLTYAAEAHISPVYSPKGRFIACVETGRRRDRCLVIDRLGGQAAFGGDTGHRIVGAPSWAPDGRRVCWITEDGSLWTMGVDGSVSRVDLPAGGRPYDVIWQPVGGRALVAMSAGVYSVPVDSSGPPRRLLTWDSWGELGPISLSRDGSRLAYIAGDTAFLTTGRGSAGRVLAPAMDDGLAYSRVWLSPDAGKALLLRTAKTAPPLCSGGGRDPWVGELQAPTGCALRGPQQRLLLADVVDLTLRDIDLSGRKVAGVAWAPDAPWKGGHPFVLSADGELVLYDEFARPSRTLVSGAFTGSAVSYDPRGRNVIFASAREPADPDEAHRPAPNLFAVATGE